MKRPQTSMCCRLMATENPQGSTDGLCCVKGKTFLGMEPSPLMDLWIMGLLYKLIVRGSGLHGAFGEKGLDRSVYPTGGMRGRSPACSLGVWRTNKRLWARKIEREHRGRMYADIGIFLPADARKTPKNPQRNLSDLLKKRGVVLRLRPRLNLLRGNNRTTDFVLVLNKKKSFYLFPTKFFSFFLLL